MTSRQSLKVLLLMSLTFFLIACSSWRSQINSSSQWHLAQSITSSPCRLVDHALGKACVPETPKRLATLSTTDLVSALALGVKPIATVFYSSPSDVPAYLKDKLDQIQVLGTRDQPSIERVIELKPDLLLGMSYSAEPIYPLISRIAPTVVYEWKGTSSWRDHFNFVAQALGKTTEATQVWAQYQQRIQALKAALKMNTTGNRPLKVSVFHICCGMLHIDVKNSFNGSILDDVGFQRPASQNVPIEGGVEFISEELLPEVIDADVLFIPTDPQDRDSKRKLSELMQSPLWQQLEVVKQGKVYLVDYHVWRGANLFAANGVIDDLFRYLVHSST
ncbi:ABC transporter substrate-binding protein [Leptolyngbya sp. AN03gr2]|uniref:ABC transporter substrate-binding protein n=1 Tax=unclassified Leptolyngbya TaxID=2650499 RepID=UPI003D312DCB